MTCDCLAKNFPVDINVRDQRFISGNISNKGGQIHLNCVAVLLIS